jgi:hypothetical protein
MHVLKNYLVFTYLDIDIRSPLFTYRFLHVGSILSLLLQIIRLLLVFINAHREIRKRTDTDVAFTREYYRVLISTRNVKCSCMNQDRLKKKIKKYFWWVEKGFL